MLGLSSVATAPAEAGLMVATTWIAAFFMQAAVILASRVVDLTRQPAMAGGTRLSIARLLGWSRVPY